MHARMQAGRLASRATTSPSVWAGALIGWLGGTLACLSVGALETALIDDPVGAVPVHAVGGAVGLLSAGLFAHGDSPASPRPGLFHGGGGHLLEAQVVTLALLHAWHAGHVTSPVHLLEAQVVGALHACMRACNCCSQVT